MSPEFSKLCKRLAIASAVAVLLPLGTAALLGGATAAAGSDASAEQTAPAPPLDVLGRANAVAWISPGHLSTR